MKTATKVIFASALMLSVVAPSISYAAYFVDQTKTWALESRAQDVMDKVIRHKGGAAQTQGSRDPLNFMAPATRRCPELVLTRTTAGPSSPDNRRDRQRLGTRRCYFFSHATGFPSPPEQIQTRECLLSGVKRTCRFALHMSALDPKRTFVS
jgi:hypothetical protein